MGIVATTCEERMNTWRPSPPTNRYALGCLVVTSKRFVWDRLASTYDVSLSVIRAILLAVASKVGLYIENSLFWRGQFTQLWDVMDA